MEKKQLPYLISLVDDDTSEVRDEVLKQLTQYGPSLEEDIKEFSDILEPNKINLIYPIIENSRRVWLKENWIKWQKLDDLYTQLEVACNLIAKFQYGITFPETLSNRLNEITEKFISKHPHGDEFDLIKFLFLEERIEGEKHDYYNPMNSNVLYALIDKRGLPITLTMILMFVGKRLGLIINGCNFPGHFLAKFKRNNRVLYVDCFNKGKIILEDEIKSLLNDSYEIVGKILEEDILATTIIRRILNNLINAYKENNDQLNRYLFSELFESTPQ